MKRIEELAKANRGEFIRDGFERNDKLRKRAYRLSMVGWTCVVVAFCTIIVGMLNSYDILRDVSNTSLYFSWLIAVVAFAVRCFTLPSRLERQADSLDYQLMAAFPDWQELLKNGSSTETNN